ncbi:MAG TPA: DUF3179 domain-containing (seleno)protein, partial [Aggregatilineales bacterium]|nr:DUF3179 domain-containing (seleno)protein [Aggregatilineales bacterium]
MRLKIALFLMVVTLFAGFWHVSRRSQAQQVAFDLSDYRTTMFQMLGAASEVRRGSEDPASLDLFNAIARSGDELYLAPLLDLAFFARLNQTVTDAAIFNAISSLSGQDFGTDWQQYFEWASANDIALPPFYSEFKGTFLSVFVDPEFQRFFPPNAGDTARVNLVEPLWGGVSVDGIPSLVNARQISPEAAAAEGLEFDEFCREGDCRYPANDEFVFGVSIDGDNRAYPLRILNWHEMFNDVFGMVPLFDAPDGESICNFRAPTPFKAVARQGEEWVQIAGHSAGCPD